jgi:hypothetical protein
MLHMQINQRFFFIVFLCVIIVGCTRPTETIDLDLFAKQLQDQQIPVSTVETESGSLTVLLSYGAEKDNIPRRSTNDDVFNILQTLCTYDALYSLKVVFADDAYIEVNMRLIREYCDGALSKNELFSQLVYVFP